MRGADGADVGGDEVIKDACAGEFPLPQISISHGTNWQVFDKVFGRRRRSTTSLR